jgi:hypothetical protein
MSRASVSHRPQQLEVTVMFEPNRMASALLQAAYLRVAPAVHRSLSRLPASLAPAVLTAPIPRERAEAGERSAP